MSNATGKKNPLGDASMVRLEDDFVGPARRGARKVGVGLGKGAAYFSFTVAVFNTLAGLLFRALSDGFLDSVGVVFIVFGVLSALFGAGLLWSVNRYKQGAEIGEIESEIRRQMVHGGSATAISAAQKLRMPLRAVEEVARQMEADGQLERDVDTERGTEVYRPLGWRGRHENEALNDPDLHSERHALEAFEKRLEQTPSDSEATAAAVVEEDEEVGVGS